jgi:hypothetical protein
MNTVHRVVLAGGAARFWRLSGRPYFDQVTAAFAGYRGTGTDVTETTQREAALDDARVRAGEAEQAARRARARLVDARRASLARAARSRFICRSMPRRLIKGVGGSRCREPSISYPRD